MGKNLENQDSISLEYVNRGCMRGFLQHINHPKWHHVKKRLPHKRHRSGSHLPVGGDPENDSITNIASTEVEGKLDGGTGTGTGTAANSEILSKSPETGSVHKSSMKSRIKALITEEVSKRRGKHHRSSSYPARLPLERIASMKTIPYGEESSSVSNLLDPLGKHSVKDHTLLQESLVYAVEQSKNSSIQESKLFLDALDLLNIRKEFFLKVLQDPRSSLSHQLRRHKAASVRKVRFHKSLSFPGSGRNHRSSTRENERIMSISDAKNSIVSAAATGEKNGLSRMPTGKYQVHESPQQMLVETDPQATLEHKERHSNKLVMKRFKKLREKVKHALKENKTERYRIIMDSIMHKVPYGRGGNAKANKQEVVMHPGTTVTKKYIKCRSANSLNSKHFCPEEKQMRRTSSFNESLERYNRLLELCLGKQAQRVPDSSRQRMCTPSSVGSSPAALKRILSLPDLRCYSLSRFEESPSTSDFPAEVLSKPLLNVGLDTHINLETSYKHGTEESAEVGGTSHNIGGLKKLDDAVSKFEVDVSETCSTMFTADEDLEPMLEDSSYQYDEDFASLTHEFSTCSPTSPENNISINQGETQTKQTSDNMLRIQVDRRIENEFNYVRDVLELSGFNGDDFFKKWHTSEQPLDLSVFEEVEECLLVHPKSSGNKEGGSWNHILLFDIINEVLLDMSEQSFSYWPVPLTYSCHAYRIPVGYHVLEEAWKNISWHLSTGWSEVELSSLDSSVSRDLSKGDGWMNLQFEVESVGLELEEWILDDLLDELFLAWPSFG